MLEPQRPVYRAYVGYEQMSLEEKARGLVGQPVGLAMANGQGVSGIICGVQGGEVYVLQYLYARQFATFHYPLRDIRDLYPYPSCQPAAAYGSGQS
ncbi:hypothetical protein WMW72_21005 [Paenibacillus filicis]|uniref:Uncharacterized protein n=1 Tax=Paenibacillus filicis TaxID=669464 RepID=A0ABU9DNE6_9BACL